MSLIEGRDGLRVQASAKLSCDRRRQQRAIQSDLLMETPRGHGQMFKPIEGFLPGKDLSIDTIDQTYRPNRKLKLSWTINYWPVTGCWSVCAVAEWLWLSPALFSVLAPSFFRLD